MFSFSYSVINILEFLVHYFKTDSVHSANKNSQTRTFTEKTPRDFASVRAGHFFLREISRRNSAKTRGETPRTFAESPRNFAKILRENKALFKKKKKKKKKKRYQFKFLFCLICGGIEPVTSTFPEWILYRLSYRGRYIPCVHMKILYIHVQALNV